MMIPTKGVLGAEDIAPADALPLAAKEARARDARADGKESLSLLLFLSEKFPDADDGDLRGKGDTLLSPPTPLVLPVLALLCLDPYPRRRGSALPIISAAASWVSRMN